MFDQNQYPTPEQYAILYEQAVREEAQKQASMAGGGQLPFPQPVVPNAGAGMIDTLPGPYSLLSATRANANALPISTGPAVGTDIGPAAAMLPPFQAVQVSAMNSAQHAQKVAAYAAYNVPEDVIPVIEEQAVKAASEVVYNHINEMRASEQFPEILTQLGLL